MAGINFGGSTGRRTANHELPLVPFIDFLLCLVAFLLVTAVWSQLARVNADARVPGAPDSSTSDRRDKQLHVEILGEHKFQLVWKQGGVVIDSIDVPRRSVSVGNDGAYRFPDLAQRIEQEWGKNGVHRAPTDTRLDQAILHASNAVPFSDLVAVMDAIHAPVRPLAAGGKVRPVSSFNVTFAMN